MSLGATFRTSLSQRVSVIIQLCTTQTKSPKPTPTKRNSLLNLSKGTTASKETILIRITSIRSKKFIEDNHRYFYPPEDPDDYRFDVGNEHELVDDVDAQTLIKLVKFLKR